MQDLFIDQGGEVRLGSDVVGNILWCGPCSFYGVVGEWEQNAGSCCWECGGLLAPAEAIEEVEEECDHLAAEKERLEKVLKCAVEEIDKLKAQVTALGGAVEVGADD